MTLGADSSFTLPPPALELLTLSPQPVRSAAATFQGEVLSGALPTTVWFQYGLDTSYVFSTPSVQVPPADGVTLVSIDVSNLKPATTYYCRIVADNGSEVKYGNGVSFTTPSTDFAVETLGTGSISTQQSTVFGTITPDGSRASAYFEYGPATNLLQKTSIVRVGKNQTVTVNRTISSLQPGTTYYYRIVGENRTDAAYGEFQSFTTLPR